MLNRVVSLRPVRNITLWASHHLGIPRVSRWIIGLGSCFLGFALTPDLLIRTGAMRTSLTSEHDLTRTLAHLEVTAARILLMLAGLFVIFAVPHLQSLIQHNRVSRLLRRVPLVVEKHQHSVWNWPLLFMTVAALTICVGSYLHHTPGQLTAEDGPLEQFTALAFFLAGIVGLWASYRRGRCPRAVPLAAMGVFFIAAAGEEVSWGQRILELSTPAVMEAYNVQGETNVHNLFGYVADHIFIAGTFLFGGVLPLACMRWQALRYMAWHLGVPVASLGLAIAFIGLSLVHQWTLGHAGTTWASMRIAEVREALAGLAFLILSLEALSADQAVASEHPTVPEALINKMGYSRTK